MNYLKKFNEEVGFDDEEMRDRLEIPNLKGELEPNSPNMAKYSAPIIDLNTESELRKILFNYPILENFLQDQKYIDGSSLISFYATSKFPVDNFEFYTQLSFAFHDGQYYVGTILRDILDFNRESEWVKYSFSFDKIEDVYEIVSAFLECCEKLGVVSKQDLDNYLSFYN